jgi:hypothetical protein
MREEFFWSIFGLVWIFGWVAVWLWVQRTREDRKLKLREMLNRERLAAIEKGVPLPEIPPLDQDPIWLSPEAERVRTRWLRRVALLVGLLAITGGVGMCAAFYWAPDRGFHGMWTLGLIPLMAGVGLLLFCGLARMEIRRDDERA